MAESKSKTYFEQLTFGVVKSLDKRKGICDVRLIEKTPAERHTVISWEQKHSCFLPEDVKSFFLTTDGLVLKWSVKVNDSVLPIGRVEINGISGLTKIAPGNSITAAKGAPDLNDIESSDEETEGDETSYPRFNPSCRIFELDPCGGFGMVCLVYRNTKPGVPAHDPEIWFMDRAYRWHFLADNFTAYFRLMVAHVGLPQWQYAFTDIGLSPFAEQWFNVYAPLRMGLDSGDYSENYEETGLEDTPNPCLDVGKVFKGKSDKKKQAASSGQAGKKKPGPPSTTQVTNKPGSGPSATRSQPTTSQPQYKAVSR
ncbi:unnamed protein product [Owenia fusiformis]|uniref:Knr4/Smi1-like domain-containing protein n=1 Tax=Owenia fusiformis TaxID=6347 RepID=A0A8S4PUH3_OWEFU|nr:unnamed protein product [Owenia fusiformis]